MTFTLSGLMLYAMWAVLGMMSLDLLVGLYRSLRAGSFSHMPLLGYLQDTLYYVLPLFVLVQLMPLDPTGWIMLIAYYLGAFGVVVKYAGDIRNKIK